MKEKKGFLIGGGLITIGILFLIIAILTGVLIFNNTIRDIISTIVGFLSASLLYIVIGIGLIVAYKIGLLTWLFVGFKSIIGRIF